MGTAQGLQGSGVTGRSSGEERTIRADGLRFRRASAGAIATAVLATVIAIAPSPPAGAGTLGIQLPAGFDEVNDFNGTLLGPTAVAWAPDGRRFVAEKSGRVRVVTSTGTLIGPPLLDIRSKVNNSSDRGLLGIATDRDFATNGYLYLLYVYELLPETPDSDQPMVSRLTRVTVNPDNTLQNPANPETVILGTYNSGPCPPADNNIDCIPADAKFHAIGTVRVDPVDGTLWVGSGDATTTSVQLQAFRTYDNESFAGKIIHVDRNGRGLANHPFCPTNTDLDDVCTKLYAKGFRNPFRFHLRPGKGPIVGDVGNSLREELDLVKPGRSYGWPCYEGDAKMPGYSQSSRCQLEYQKEGTPDAHVGPNWAYPHEGGASITAGPAITNDSYPQSYQGDIFVGDFVKGWIKRLEFDADGNLEDIHPFATAWGGGVDLIQAPTGELSYVDIGWDMEPTDGAVRRFVYSADNEPPVPVAKASPTSGPSPLTVQFDGDDSTDPENDPLTYRWDFGDGETSNAANPTHVYTTPKTYEATLRVDDGLGRNPTDTIEITVNGDPPPVAAIATPANNSLYVDGAEVQLQGSATDDPDGSLTGNSLSWQVLLHHNTHVHQIGTFTGTSSSFNTLDNHDSDSFYEIKLTATDSAGQSDTETVKIYPRTVALTLDSAPRGAPISYDNLEAEAAPFVRQAASGFQASIVADASFTRNGTTYNFVGWSNGELRQQIYTVPNQAVTLTANYEAASGAPVNTTPPSIAGDAKKGAVLAAAPGGWSGTEPMDLTYRWRSCPPYDTEVAADAPLAHWRLGETGGNTALDSSGHARDGSYVTAPGLGVPGAITGDADTAVGFVETGDRMTVADDNELRLNDDFSIEFWSKLNAYTNTYPGIFRKGSSASSGTGYAIFYNSDLRPNFKRAGIQKKSSAAAALSTDSFRHYVVSYNAANETLKWFVDGALDKTYTSTVLPENIDPSSLQIGRGDHYGNHVIDEVALYATALPGARVAAHYDAGRQGCRDVEDATSSTFTPGDDQVGMRLKVRVTATNGAGAASATSDATDPIVEDVGRPPTNTASPKIDGDAVETSLLSASTGEWAGSTPRTYEYRWQRCPTYPGTVRADAPLAYWRLGEGSGTNAKDSSGNLRDGRYVNGPLRGQLGALGGDANTAAAFVETGDRVEVQDADAIRMNDSFSIEFWAKLRSFGSGYPGFLRKGVSSSSGSGYLVFYNSDLRPNFKRAGIQKKASVAAALSTDTFKHYVIAYDEGLKRLRWYVNGALDSSYSNVALPESLEAGDLHLGRGDKYGDHVLDEVALYGAALSPGRVAAHFAAGGQACTDIPDATTDTYIPTSTDVGARLRVLVTATNDAGMTTAPSDATDVVTAVPVAPAMLAEPAIAGTPERGETLTVRRGSWRGTPPVSYDYSWKRCRYSKSLGRLVCSRISTEHDKRYEPRKHDVGYRLKVKVIASNSAGRDHAFSRPTKKVTT